MIEFFNFLFDVILSVDMIIYLLGAGVIILFGFTVFLILGLYYLDKERAERLFKIFTSGILFIFLSLSLIRSSPSRAVGGFFALVGLSLFLYLILSIISPKKVKVTQQEKNLIESIDENLNIKKEKEVKKITVPMTQNVKDGLDILKKQGENGEKVKEIDYSHVKSVIEKMSLYNLTESEKREVENLRLNVLSAENGDERPFLRAEINDGLGVLLKIMASHKV